MVAAETELEADLLEAARRGDAASFDRLLAPYRGELRAHCYRMLGSTHDADDALQETLLGAWKGLGGFEARSSLRAWLYRIATHACLRLVKKPRILPVDFGPAAPGVTDLGEPVGGGIWLEPFPTDPQDRYELRESVELAYVAALQLLPATQRAVLILREVLAFSAAEVAEQLDLTVAAVNSALQRARKTVEQHQPERSQQATLAALGEAREQALVLEFVAAWERADVDALLALLTEDVRFAMPPLPAWFDGRASVGRFFAERVFATPWRLLPLRANGQPAFACYQDDGTGFQLGAFNVITLRGDRIAAITGFLDPGSSAPFGIPAPPTDEFLADADS